jgi:hypothetical protein
MKITIGSIVDFIQYNTRYRGLVTYIVRDNIYIVVLGEDSIHMIDRGSCIPVKEAKAFIDLCRS